MKIMHRSFPTALLLSPLIFLLSPELIPICEAVWINIPHTGSKCVSEEIQPNVVVLADYIVISDEHSIFPTVSVKVTSPYGNVLHHKENATNGHFAFTTQESGIYLACFEAEGKSHGNKDISINIDWKTGIAAKDWDSIAKKEKIEGVELELTKLDAVVEAIHESLLYLRNREAEMRIVSEKTNSRVAWYSIMSLGICIVSEKTNSRVAWYSIMSLGICIVVSGLQILYLKNYFEKKKLI